MKNQNRPKDFLSCLSTHSLRSSFFVLSLAFLTMLISLSACSGGYQPPENSDALANQRLCSPQEGSQISAEALGALVAKTNAYASRIRLELQNQQEGSSEFGFEVFCDLELEIDEHRQNLETLLLQELRFSSGFEQISHIQSMTLAYQLLAQQLCSI